MKKFTVKLQGVTEKHEIVAQSVTFNAEFVVFLDEHNYQVAAYRSNAVVWVKREDAEPQS